MGRIDDGLDWVGLNRMGWMDQTGTGLGWLDWTR